MFLDKSVLKDQCFNLCVSDDDLDVGNLPYQSLCLCVNRATHLEIGSDAIAKTLCFSNVNDLPIHILMQIDPRLGRQAGYLLQQGV